MILTEIEDLLRTAKNPVIITGAGVSTLSGIPDYSTMPGMLTEIGYLPARKLLTVGFCYNFHDDFVEWFTETFYQNKQPNKVHDWISKMDKELDNLVVLTQNVDGLQKATNLIEYHGNAHKWKCEKCHKVISKEQAKMNSYLCIGCNHPMQPNIVLYGQFVESSKQHKAEKARRQADCMVVLGTALDVAPFCDLVFDYAGPHVYWIDKFVPKAWHEHQDINLIQSDFVDFFK